MRKLVLLTLFAAAALLSGAASNAFAHPSHHHVQQAQSALSANFEIVVPAIEYAAHSDEVVSSAQPQADHCPHGQGAGCDSCCACAGNTSVALATPDFESGGPRMHNQVSALTAAYEIRQAVLDLSRPPKSFT